MQILQFLRSSCTRDSCVIHWFTVKTLTVRLPEPLVAQIVAESRERKVSKSDVVRERLQNGAARRPRRSKAFDGIADLIGAVDGLSIDLSARRKHHLKATAYGRKRPR